MVTLSLATCCSLGILSLLTSYVRHKRSLPNGSLGKATLNDDLPFVTVQLPIFNEPYVIESLLDAVSAFAYPQTKSEIQVLDDSMDETPEIVRRKVRALQSRGVQISHLQRNNRQGFKAGALREGMKVAQGEFLAIFDADFQPPPDFLLATLPHFKDQRVGAVQMRLEFMNKDESLLTRIQYALHNLFNLAQLSASPESSILQFNGTGGIWRKEAITQADGWQGDTLTEDLDLSLRAQLNGWQIFYVENPVSPGLLPTDMKAFKTQQFRWSKGRAETARKLLRTIWKSSFSLSKKIEASIYLFDYSFFMLLFLIGIFSIPIYFFHRWLPTMNVPFMYGLLGVLVTCPSIVACVANVLHCDQDQHYRIRVWRFLYTCPLSILFNFGMSFHHTVAATEGLLGKKSPFMRTPKKQPVGMSGSRRITWRVAVEGIMAAVFTSMVCTSLCKGYMSLVPLYVLYALGFGIVFGFSCYSPEGKSRSIEATCPLRSKQ